MEMVIFSILATEHDTLISELVVTEFERARESSIRSRIVPNRIVNEKGTLLHRVRDLIKY